MSVYGETRKIAFAPAGEMLAALCLTAVSLVGHVATTAGAIGRAIERRRVMSELAGLDDRMLRDIGVTRADLRDATSGPLLADPTRVLILRATERRAAARLAGRAQQH
ncbi:DUF1127 domain-containing protein [Xanthobacter autotrophicus]|uniref:DUF1127 domain-containing protein n=1 Tax=Xanthobacter autotrophicus TaxID=280 RepID=UPI0024A74A60|nr:DUF1127 domain-containing protein [Xanthobacter autotrophicus]MDI4656692.1 DUF1127 domain-containing protein [Xanthobacter autotrophicus]